MNKIKNITISGLRGIKEKIEFHLNSRSILLYGENGSGKSSVTDALEWFYYDKIEHLSSEEIGRKGIEGLRNFHIPDSEAGLISIDYLNSKLNCSKTISIDKDKIITSYTNQTPEFSTFLKESQKEQITLRYRDLVSFILATKTEKLNALSEIIGFSEVIKTREVLKKTLSTLKREIKTSNITSQIDYQQKELISQLDQNVYSDEQYISAINTLLKPVALGKEVSNLDELDKILELLKKPEDDQIVKRQLFLENIKSSTNQLRDRFKNIHIQYEEYYHAYKNIISDMEKLNKLKLEALLSEGSRVIKEDIIKDEVCPLCLQPKNKLDLLRDIESRLEELQEYKRERSNLEQLKTTLLSEIAKSENLISTFLSDPHMDLNENKIIKSTLIKTKEASANYKNQVAVDVLSGEKLKLSTDLIIDESILKQIESFSSDNLDKLRESRKGDKKFDILGKIMVSRNAYLNIKKLKKSNELFESQQYALEKLNTLFIKKMEEGFNLFLSHLSKDINDLYMFMNPGEHIEDINLVPIQKNDEFSGITIQFNFFKNQVTPPNKYLSESHLNCLGIAFFLTSVKALNKTNRFFLLDDVISSFDSNHRARFAHLLNEKFSDYQIVLMTHEKNWFDYISKIVKGKNWLINIFKWHEDTGPSIEIPITDLRQIRVRMII
jgi:energy-coupling factor transporter ATP-binding protein EcfA2